YNGGGNPSQIAYGRDPNAVYSVEIEFTGVQAGIESVKNEGTKSKFKKFADGKDTIRVIRRSTNAKKRLLWEEDKQDWSDKNFAGFDTSFNDCIPRLEYISTVTHLEEISKWGKKTPIGLMLSGVLSALLETSPKYQEFKEKFEDVFGHSDSE